MSLCRGRAKSFLLLALWGIGVAACAQSKAGSGADGGSHPSADGPPVPDIDAGPVGGTTDFPPDPIVEGGAPPDSAGLFGGGGSNAGGPCLTEPELGALIPVNWLRMRIAFAPVGGQNLFEIRVHVDDRPHDLLVYTTKTTWTMPKDMWTGLVTYEANLPVTITVRGAVLSGGALSSPPAMGSTGAVRIAPAQAGGAIVYWTPSNGTKLRGFHIGDETVQDVLTPGQATSVCIGCHTSTPDGKYAAFTAVATADADDIDMSVGLRSVDGTASPATYVSASGKAMIARVMQMAPAFSTAHFTTGDRVALSMYNDTDIAWTDLEASSQAQGTGWGIIARTGDSGNAATANFSHDGKRIAYCSTTQPVVSGVQTNSCDLWTVPYNNKAGGTATKVAGASDASHGEFYPAFSPDDKLLAFSRLPAAEDTYNNPLTEVYVVPVGGGTAVRLKANDPPACTGAKSPGITNSWPKWSPTVTTAGGKTYYWVTYSSTRNDGSHPQIFATAITVDASGAIETFPSLYLWNQPANEGNHTPAWDDFQIVVN
jgi:mono/diheme cytochrome c family protein